MTRTVKLVGGVVTALAVVVLLAVTFLGTGGPASPGVTSSGPFETLGSNGPAPSGVRSSTCVPPEADSDGLDWVCLAELPKQAQQTVELIEAGGPFPYAKDGATFNNFEGVLPKQRRGYYREYTVQTPGERDRGARRIVTGDHDRELFYTDDHYESFRRVQR